ARKKAATRTPEQRPTPRTAGVGIAQAGHGTAEGAGGPLIMHDKGTAAMSQTSGRRRQLILGGSAALISAPLTAAQRTLTPSQMLGPFYPVTPPLHKDNDLTQVEGRSARAAGQIADLSGRVLDINGRPLAGLRVEIWQCDANGRYRHPRDTGGLDE